MNKITIFVAIITFISILFVSQYTEKFIGSQYNVIVGYFPQSVVTDKLKDVSDLQTCINACDTDTQCNGFYMSGTNCWKVKDTNIPQFIKTTNPSIFNPISGLKQYTQCDLVQQMFKGRCSNNDYPGNDLLPAPFFQQTESFVECAQSCIDNDKCIGVSYDTKRKRCFLKNKMRGNGNPAKDRMSWVSPRV